MLKTIGNTGSAANPKKTKGKADGNNIVGNNMVDGGKATNQTNSTKRKNQVKTTKSKILVKSKNQDFLSNSRNKETGTSFLTSEARLAFTQLRQAFIEAPILHYFDLKSHIRIETNASGYAINCILIQLTSKTRPDGIVTKTNLGQYYPVAFFFRKMIFVATWFKTHNGKLLVIVETFKTWWYYLESCKYKVFIFTNYNNLNRFMNTKSLTSRQVCWAQKLFCYYFYINYQQSKVNGAIDALS